ncbi:hypothetical protein RFI_09091, partial [Reticulomyxa filosa]
YIYIYITYIKEWSYCENKIESLTIENYNGLAPTNMSSQEFHSDLINLLANVIENNGHLRKISFLTNTKNICRQLRHINELHSTLKHGADDRSSGNAYLDNEYKSIQKWVSTQTHDCGYYVLEYDSLVHTLTKAFARNISLQSVELFPLSFSACTYTNIGFFLKGLFSKNIHLRHLVVVLSDLNSNTNRYMDIDMSISDIQLFMPSSDPSARNVSVGASHTSSAAIHQSTGHSRSNSTSASTGSGGTNTSTSTANSTSTSTSTSSNSSNAHANATDDDNAVPSHSGDKDETTISE